MEEGLAAGSLSWQGVEGADGCFQVCGLLGTVSVCEYQWLLCCERGCAIVAAALRSTVNTKGARLRLSRCCDR